MCVHMGLGAGCCEGHNQRYFPAQRIWSAGKYLDWISENKLCKRVGDAFSGDTPIRKSRRHDWSEEVI